MPNSSAINCANGSKKGLKVHKFPRDSACRKLWIQNCHEDKWIKTESSVLCDVGTYRF
jgi:hypothetical protein